MTKTLYFKTDTTNGYDFEYTVPEKHQTIRDIFVFGGHNKHIGDQYMYTWTQDDMPYITNYIIELCACYPMEPVNYTSYELSVVGTQKLYEFLKMKIDHCDSYHLRLMLAYLLFHQLSYTDTLECMWYDMIDKNVR